MRAASAKALRGMHRVGVNGASAVRKLSLRARFPGITFVGPVTVGPNCSITAGEGAVLRVESCHIAQGVTLTAGPEAELLIDADFIGPWSSVVARSSVRIGKGTKIAERVTVRDSDHDHAFPLASAVFTSAPVHLADDVWLGAGSSVLKGCRVGAGATVAAGAVVTHDVADGTIVGGVPAVVISPGRRPPASD
jgi:acetyltransferase-like isoleucine patch superfamily enzyme